MNEGGTIRDLAFSDVDDEDIANDPDYEPRPSELGVSDSDVSMSSSDVHNATSSSSTDVSIPSTVPSDAQSIGDASEIYPDDSISQRNAKLAAVARRYQPSMSDASETPSIVSFHSSGELARSPYTLCSRRGTTRCQWPKRPPCGLANVLAASFLRRLLSV